MSDTQPQVPSSQAVSTVSIESQSSDTKSNVPQSSYSHDATVAAITSFYELVSGAFCVAELEYPPPGGWPNLVIRDDNDAVTKLLRHLPYFNNEDETLFIMNHTYPFNFVHRRQVLPGAEAIARMKQEQEEKERRKLAEADGLVQPDPTELSGSADDNDDWSHIVQIAASSGRYGCNLFIDTKRGALICHYNEGLIHPPGDEKPDLPSLEDPGSEEWMARAERYRWEEDPEEWRCAPTYRIETFFSMCTREFLECKWMPMLEDMGGDVCIGGKEKMRIMKACGWPGEAWDPVWAMEEMESVLENGGYL